MDWTRVNGAQGRKLENDSVPGRMFDSVKVSVVARLVVRPDAALTLGLLKRAWSMIAFGKLGKATHSMR